MIKLRALTAETFTKKFARGGKFSPKNGRLSPIAALFPHCEGAFPLPPCVRGEACVMRSSTVCCARMPNLEIAIFSGDLRRRRFPFAPPRGGLPQARREGRPFRPCGAPSWRCPAVVTLPSRYRSTPPLKILQIFRGGKRHSFQGRQEALISGEAWGHLFQGRLNIVRLPKGSGEVFGQRKDAGCYLQLASVSERRQLPILPGR